MSSSRPDTAATKRGVDSEENIRRFIYAKEATTYDNLLLDGSISNADVRNGYDGWSGLHTIPYEDVDDILICYLLTCDPPADVNGRDGTCGGHTPMWLAAFHNNTSAVKVLIDFGGDRTIKTNSYAYSYPNTTPLDIAKKKNNQEIITMLTECFPSEE